MVIAYTRSVTSNAEESCAIQRQLIGQYCNKHHLHLDALFQDLSFQRRLTADVLRIKSLGYEGSYRREKFFPEWERMLSYIVTGSVTVILVDLKNRLFTNQKLHRFFQAVCEEFNVKVIEVCKHSSPNMISSGNRVAVYHFTDLSAKRPIIAEKEIDELYSYAAHHPRWAVQGLYFDHTLIKSQQSEHQRFLRECDSYDILLTKDFYHVDDKMGPFLQEAMTLIQVKGLELHSIINGSFHLPDTSYLLSQSFRVAIYDNANYTEEERQLKIDVFHMFIKTKTNWSCISMFLEDKKSSRDEEQYELAKLISQKDTFDIILVDSVSKLSERVSIFYKRWDAIRKPIYSLKEGGFVYDKGQSRKQP